MGAARLGKEDGVLGEVSRDLARRRRAAGGCACYGDLRVDLLLVDFLHQKFERGAHVVRTTEEKVKDQGLVEGAHKVGRKRKNTAVAEQTSCGKIG